MTDRSMTSSTPTSLQDAPDYSALRKAFADAGQDQVFRFWDDLSTTERETLISDAQEIDLQELQELTLKQKAPAALDDFENLQPAPFKALPQTNEEAESWKDARKLGEKAIRDGKVAAFTVAGGQGTRLGYDGPKGTFPVTPVTNKPLFQVFAEKILAARIRYETEIPWFIMTSHANHEQTEKFFRDHNFFGLPENDVFFFRQGRMPAIDENGKILLEKKDRIAMSPDGHGGSLRALYRSGAIAEMEKRGIDTISYFQVDNPLAHIIDPTFLGFHLAEKSEMSSKMIPKAYPEEKVGVFAMRDETMLVVEYSDLPEDLAHRRDDSGDLVFQCGSIAIHLLSVPFVKKLGGSDDENDLLPFHLAHKKVATIDESGQPIEPDEPNGIKFEMFVFDALPSAKNPLVIEARRADEFSPVKNAEGVDSPETCRTDQLKQFARWLKAAGASIETDADDIPAKTFEISPLFAVDESSFLEAWNRLNPKPEIHENFVISPIS